MSTIPDDAFYNYPGCATLAGIIIPDRVTRIGDRAFSGCTSLTSVRFERANITLDDGIMPPVSSFIDGNNGLSLKTAYLSGGIGTYTRPNTTSSTWTKISN